MDTSYAGSQVSDKRVISDVPFSPTFSLTASIEVQTMSIRLHATTLLVPVFLAFAPPGTLEQVEPTAKSTPSITIKMEDCQATRPGRTDIGLLRLLLFGPPKDQLVKRGAIDVDGQTYHVYLPKASSYTIKNKAKPGTDEDTSTLVSIDLDQDGQLTEQESWYASLPIRIGDRMFDVEEIAESGARIVLKPSTAPVRGLIKGRQCPPFKFATSDGKEISLGTLKGKTFLLDIWSVT
jgi:hypothetical protein